MDLTEFMSISNVIGQLGFRCVLDFPNLIVSVSSVDIKSMNIHVRYSVLGRMSGSAWLQQKRSVETTLEDVGKLIADRFSQLYEGKAQNAKWYSNVVLVEHSDGYGKVNNAVFELSVFCVRP